MRGLEIKTAGMKALEESVLFRTMTKEEILDVIDAMDPRVRRFQKKDMILQDGELVGSMMIVLSGKIHLFHIDPNGNSNLLEVPGPGDTVGMLNAVGKYRLHVSAMALEETELLLIDVDLLLRGDSPITPLQLRFLRNLTVALAQKAHDLTVKLEDSVRRSTREKLQDYLSARYHEEKSRTFSIPLNRQELADFLFADRSAMSKELCKMRDEGLLKFEKSKFELLIKMPMTDEEMDPNEKL